MKRIVVTIVALIAPSAGSLANEPNEKLLALSEQERHSALTEHVRRNGQDCNAVVRSMLLNDAASDKALWSVGCQNQKTYAVTIYADPQLRPFAVSCEDLKDYGKMLGLMERRLNQPQSTAVHECWKKF